MALVPCVNCGNSISKNAKVCPHCSHVFSATPKVEHAPCRICGKNLEKLKYRWATKHVYAQMVNGTSSTHTQYHIHHEPCPRCGEPKPLQKFIDKPFGNFVFYSMLSLIYLIGSGLSAYITGYISSIYGFPVFYPGIFGLSLGFFLVHFCTKRWVSLIEGKDERPESRRAE